MSDRIRYLEDSIRSNNPNSPLLAPELTTIKSTMGLYSSNGTPGNTQDKDAKFNGLPSSDGQKCGNNNVAIGDAVMRIGSPPCIIQSVRYATPIALVAPADVYPTQGNSITFDLTSLQPDVSHFQSSFPLLGYLHNSPERNLTMREHIRSQLPSREEVERLWDQAWRNALWQYNPHPSASFFPLLLHHIYASPDESPKPIQDIDPRRLALLLMILSIACIVDVPSSSSSHSSTPHHLHNAHLEAESRASHFHALGRASLCEISIMEDTNVETVLALSYEVWFLAVWSDGKKALEEAWTIMGLVAKLAQTVSIFGYCQFLRRLPQPDWFA